MFPGEGTWNFFSCGGGDDRSMDLCRSVERFSIGQRIHGELWIAIIVHGDFEQGLVDGKDARDED